ncbi:ABC transporter substrate-binding protein, partial [Corynebacterium variabile]|uniref:ABC transporter substrate-binding protein n=1 Tax=Corynebacterium variabile TaxID=1727 RepID=UPI003F8F597E
MRIPTFTTGRRLRTTALALTVTAALAGSLAACSDDDSDSSDSSATAAQSGTVEVNHTMGTTEVPAAPGKIISFSPAFTDAFSALGRPVDVEYRTDFYGEPGPWENGDSGETVTYSMTGTPDVEKVAEADPDVIFAGYLPDQATYDRYNQIAPTIATVGSSPMSDDWREATTVAGDVLGKSDEATKLVEDADQAFADAKENHPALDGATGAFGQISEQGLAVVTGDSDPANVFLTDLGIVIPEEIKAASLNGSRAFISEE